MRLWFGGLVAFLFVSFHPALHASPVTKIVVFGDSLSDPGNLYEASGRTDPPVPPYYEGRFSNGPVWVDYLAAQHGIAVESHAVGGATTGTHNVANQSPGQYDGLQQQVQAWAAGQGGGADPDAVYFIWAGSNDFSLLPPDATPDQISMFLADAIGNLLNAAATLYAAGAQKVMIGNVPDLGLTPEAREAGLSDQFTMLVQAFNAELAAAVQQMFAEALILDSFSMLHEIVAMAEDLGITNVTDACLVRGESITQCANPEAYLFWDIMHPTTEVHRLFAARMAGLLAPEQVSEPVTWPIFLVILPAVYFLWRRRAGLARP